MHIIEHGICYVCDIYVQLCLHVYYVLYYVWMHIIQHGIWYVCDVIYNSVRSRTSNTGAHISLQRPPLLALSRPEGDLVYI